MSIISLTKNTLERFIYIKPSYAFLLSEFVVATHTDNPAVAIPAITSLLPGHGKTQTVKVLTKLTAGGMHVKDASVAGLKREVDKGVRTILLDETDKWMFKLKVGSSFALILNCIFDQDDAKSLLCEQDKNNKFSPVALALSGRPVLIAGKGILTRKLLCHPNWDTVLDRSFPIHLEPYPDSWLKDHEIYKGNEARYAPTLAIVNNEISEWVKKHKDALADCDPSMRLPSGRLLTMRDADKYRLMLHIADVDGCGDEARSIVEGLLEGREPDFKRLLIAACLAVFNARGVKRMSSEELIRDLSKIEHPGFRKIKSIGTLYNEDNLGAIPQIKKTKVWLAHDGRSAAGYKIEDIIVAHETYCKPEDDAFVAKLMGDEKSPKYPPKTEEPEECNEINGLSMEKTEEQRKSTEELAEMAGMMQTAGTAGSVDWQPTIDKLEASLKPKPPDPHYILETARMIVAGDEAKFDAECKETEIDLWEFVGLLDDAADLYDNKSDEAMALTGAANRIRNWVHAQEAMVRDGSKPNGKWH